MEKWICPIRKNKAALIFLLAAGLLPAAGETQAPRYSLAEVLSRVERQNSLLASFHDKIAAAGQEVKSAKAWMPPLLEAGAGELPYGGGDPRAYTFSFEQPIPGLGKVRAKAAYLNALVSLETADSAYTWNQLLVEAKTAYYERYIAERRLQVLAENLGVMKLLIGTSEAGIAYGKADVASVYKAKARFATMEAMQVHEQASAKEATVMMNYLMGGDLEAPFNIDTALTLKYYPAVTPDTAMKSLALRRSDLRKMDNTIQSMKLSRSLLLSRASPDFGVKYEHMAMPEGERRYSLMATMTLPFVPWSSNDYQAEAKGMESRISAMEKERQNLLLETTQRTKTAFLKTQSEYGETDKYVKEALPALKKNLELTLIAYRQNTGDLREALMAWDDLQAGQMEYLFHLETAFKVEAQYEKEIEQP